MELVELALSYTFPLVAVLSTWPRGLLKAPASGAINLVAILTSQAAVGDPVNTVARDSQVGREAEG